MASHKVVGGLIYTYNITQADNNGGVVCTGTGIGIVNLPPPRAVSKDFHTRIVVPNADRKSVV